MLSKIELIDPKMLSIVDSKLQLLFHGYGGPDANTDAIVTNLSQVDGRSALCYNWLAYRGGILRSAFNGQRVGKVIGRQLASFDNINDLHCIGISVGSFAADACIDEFKKQKKKVGNVIVSIRDQNLSLLCHRKVMVVIRGY